MRNDTDPAEAQIDAAAIFCAIVSPHWLADLRCQRQLARALAQQKPIRLVCLPGVRVPEHLALGAQDLAVFRVPRTPAGRADMAAAAAWIEEQVRALSPEKGKNDA